MYEVEDSEASWGLMRALVVESTWDPAVVEAYRRSAANAIWWAPPPGSLQDCAGLVELADSLCHVGVTARSAVNDAALGHLVGLRSLLAATKARNPLDLSGLTGLEAVSIDDRPGLEGLGGEALTAATRTRNRTGMAAFEDLPSLTHVTLSGSRSHVVDLRGRFPTLTWLMIEGNRVLSLSGLDAPRLEHLKLLGKADGEVLDLAPLAALPTLSSVAISGAGAVKNIGAILERPELEVRIGRRTQILGLPLSASGQRRLDEQLVRF